MGYARNPRGVGARVWCARPAGVEFNTVERYKPTAHVVCGIACQYLLCSAVTRRLYRTPIHVPLWPQSSSSPAHSSLTGKDVGDLGPNYT